MHYWQNSVSHNMAKVGYARVSTKDQVLTPQLEALQKAGCDLVFADHGVSGIVNSRPQFDAALTALQPGDTFCVYSLSRAGRSMSHLTMLLESFKGRNIKFQSLTEGIDTNTHMGEMIYGILASIAQFERSVTRERCEMGRESAREKGIRFGQKPKISPEMVDYLRHAMTHGVSIGELVMSTGFSRSSIYRVTRP